MCTPIVDSFINYLQMLEWKNRTVDMPLNTKLLSTVSTTFLIYFTTGLHASCVLASLPVIKMRYLIIKLVAFSAKAKLCLHELTVYQSIHTVIPYLMGLNRARSPFSYSIISFSWVPPSFSSAKIKSTYLLDYRKYPSRSSYPEHLQQ